MKGKQHLLRKRKEKYGSETKRKENYGSEKRSEKKYTEAKQSEKKYTEAKQSEKKNMEAKQNEKKNTEAKNEAKRKIRKRNKAKRKVPNQKEKYESETKQKEKFGKQKEAKKLKRKFRLNTRNGSETNPVSLRFSLEWKKILSEAINFKIGKTNVYHGSRCDNILLQQFYTKNTIWFFYMVFMGPTQKC